MLDPERPSTGLSRRMKAPPGHRVLHAKGRFYSGTFNASPKARPSAGRLHLHGETVPILVRWSNGGGQTRPRRPPGRPRHGRLVRAARRHSTDLLGQTAPRFPVRTPEDFVRLPRSTRDRKAAGRSSWRTRPRTAALAASTNAPGTLGLRRSYAEATYFPIHAYRWLTLAGHGTLGALPLRAAGRRRRRPTGQSFTGRDRLQDEIARQARPGRSATTWSSPSPDPRTTRTTRCRCGRAAASSVAGWLEITTPEADHEADGDVVVFDPTRVVDGIELSDDPILRYRARAYAVSVGAPVGRPALTERALVDSPNVKALVIGTGGREHALALALSRDPGVTEVHAAPGNPGIAAVATLHAVDPMSGEAVAALAVALGADLVVVGPEAPLVAGVADAVTAAGVTCFGPSGAAARLEGSKEFAKDVMAAAGVPTADARACSAPDEVAAALDAFGPPYVVKDDGLAAGKGVLVTDDRAAALAHAATCARVIVEEYLDGPEVSLFAITDGATVLPMQPAQDFKRIHDGDRGPNTGGMGAYTPLPWAPADLVEEVLRDVLQPTVDEMARRGTPFRGLLYAGLALTARGVRVVEFNARFGDPETQPLLALLDSPLSPLLVGAATGTLHEVPPPAWKTGAAVTVVMASRGYPESSSSGDVIVGCETLDVERDVHVIHAGTARDEEGRLVTAGGRVLAVTAVGADLADARAKAYEGVVSISFPGAQWRRDIAAVEPTTRGPRLACALTPDHVAQG